MLGWLIAGAALLALVAALCLWGADVHIAVEGRLETAVRLKLAGALPVMSAQTTLWPPWPREEALHPFAVWRCRILGLPIFMADVYWDPPGPDIFTVHMRLMGWPVHWRFARRGGRWTVNGRPVEQMRTVRLYRRLRSRPVPFRAIREAVSVRHIELMVGGALEADRAAILSGLLNSLDSIARARSRPYHFRWAGGDKKRGSLTAGFMINLAKLVTLSRENKQRKAV